MSDLGHDEQHDPFMLELFHVELENHTRILETGLVEAENEQSPEKIEPLMRAAHSIKGAARIVNLPMAVALAHAMEDILASAQLGMISLSSGHVDALLQANDIFLSLSRVEPMVIPSWLEAQAAAIETATGYLAGLSKGEIPVTSPPRPSRPSDSAETPSPPVTSQPTVIQTETSQTAAEGHPPDASVKREAPQRSTGYEKTDGLLVRVMADNLNRLMGLAGECLVQAQSTKSFFTVFLKIKTISLAMEEGLEQLRQKYPDMSKETDGTFSACVEQIQELATGQATDFELFSRRLEHLAHKLYGEVIASRMVPFSDGLHGYSRMVRDVAKELGKKVNFQVRGEATPVDRDILEKLEAPLSHLLRNAVDHGLELPDERTAAGKTVEGKLVLEAQHAGGLLHIYVSEDGRGIDPEELRRKVIEKGYVNAEMAASLSKQELLEFLFLPGFSTASHVTQISGRGVGLDVVYSMAQEVGGIVRVESDRGIGTRFHLQLPLTLSILRTLLIEISGETYALPLARIDRVVEVPHNELHVIEDRQFCLIDGESVGIIDAHQLFHLPVPENQVGRWRIVVISDRLSRYGLVVDRFLGERDLVVRPLDSRLGKIPNISAGAILQDGSPVLVFDVEDLVRSIDNLLKQGHLSKLGFRREIRATAKKRILVVDDSLTVREVERKLLDSHGYQVTVAVDGIDGWNTLQSAGAFDLIISDIDMPRMNGIELVRKIRSDPVIKDIPVMIVSYKDREEDRLKGLEAGANYYLTKSSFHDERLLGAVRDLIGSE